MPMAVFVLPELSDSSVVLIVLAVVVAVAYWAYRWIWSRRKAPLNEIVIGKEPGKK